MKTIDDKAGDALNLVHDLIFCIDPSDTARLRDIIIQTQTALHNNLINNGLSAALRHAGRGISAEAALAQQLDSGTALHLLNHQIENFDTASDAIIANILKIRAFLLDPSRWTVSFTGSDCVFEQLLKTLEQWSSQMGSNPIAKLELPFTPLYGLNEGLSAPIKVAHCAKVMPAPGTADPNTPLYELGLYLTNFDYFLPEIRFKGNAYGAGSQYNASQGTLAFFSYNDPRISETISVFDGVRDFIAGAEWSQTDINRAIIGSAKKIVQPIRPAEANLVALMRYIRGESDELREQKYAATCGATPQTVKATLLNQLEQAEPMSNICITASRENLEQANEQLKNKLSIKNVLDPI
jgi:Zn-dependent M16 (insulinase) family peptidase